MDQHYFVTYTPLPSNIEDGSAVEQWVERMKFICDDLTWLLQQDHTKFWCEVCISSKLFNIGSRFLFVGCF
jgi:hypothetical protein